MRRSVCALLRSMPLWEKHESGDHSAQAQKAAFSFVFSSGSAKQKKLIVFKLPAKETSAQ